MPNILDEIRIRPRPADLANWWARQDAGLMAAPLVEEELGDLELFTSSRVDTILRIGRGTCTIDRLSAKDKALAAKNFGSRVIDVARFVNYENRRRIVAHYALTHPATVHCEVQLYRLTRDINPLTFIAERVWQTTTGKEASLGVKCHVCRPRMPSTAWHRIRHRSGQRLMLAWCYVWKSWA